MLDRASRLAYASIRRPRIGAQNPRSSHSSSSRRARAASVASTFGVVIVEGSSMRVSKRSEAGAPDERPPNGESTSMAPGPSAARPVGFRASPLALSAGARRSRGPNHRSRRRSSASTGRSAEISFRSGECERGARGSSSTLVPRRRLPPEAELFASRDPARGASDSSSETTFPGLDVRRLSPGSRRRRAARASAGSSASAELDSARERGSARRGRFALPGASVSLDVSTGSFSRRVSKWAKIQSAASSHRRAVRSRKLLCRGRIVGIARSSRTAR